MSCPLSLSDGGGHKVHIYKEYHSGCLLVEIGTLPTPISPTGEGLGESQFRRLEKKLSTLPTLWGGDENILWIFSSPFRYQLYWTIPLNFPIIFI